MLSMARKMTKLGKISPVQSFPSPSYPGLHVQLSDPLVLLQTALELQLWVPSLHSLMSEIILIDNRNKRILHLCVLDFNSTVYIYNEIKRRGYWKVVTV